MFCKNCGLEIKDNHKFCAQCGTALEVVSENQNTNQSVNNNQEPGKKKSFAFWGVLFGIEALVFIGLFAMIFVSTFKMLDVDINTSMKGNLSVLEKYEYNIQDNGVYLTNEDEYSYIAMKEDTTIEYYVFDDEIDALNQFSGLYKTVVLDTSYGLYGQSSVDLEDYKKYVLTTVDKIYILILDDEDVLYIKGDKAFTNEYNNMLNEMGYKDVKISPLFIVSMVLLSLLMIAGCFFIYWKLFVKAGIPGWYALIPFMNVYYLYKLSFGRGSYFLTIFVPFVNIIFVFILFYKLAKAFNKSDMFAILNIFLLPFTLQIIALDDSKYVFHMRED